MEIDITNLKSAFETLKSSMEVLEENLRNNFKFEK